MTMTPEQRSIRAKVAANARWARTADRTKGTAAATRAAFQRYLDEVDPDKQMPEAVRVARAEQLRRSKMQALALQSSQARSEAPKHAKRRPSKTST